MNGASEPHKPCISSISVMRTFRCIYVNCFTRIWFLAEVSEKLQKCTFIDNLRTITQEGNMETRQMTPFLSTFSTLFVTFLLVLKND